MGDVSVDPQYGLGRQFLPNFQFPIYIQYIYRIFYTIERREQPNLGSRGGGDEGEVGRGGGGMRISFHRKNI